MLTYNKIGFDKESGLFNKEIKEFYLTQVENVENTYKTVLGTFKLIAQAEKDFSKDLFEMNKEEFGEALKTLKAKSLKSLIVRFSILSNYDTWAYNNGYSSMTISSLFTQDDLHNYVFKVNNFIGYDEIIDTFVNNTDKSVNALNIQDVTAMLLLFESVKGVQNQELCNLRMQDVNYEDKTVTVRTFDESGNITNERVVPVRDTTLEYIKKATLETVYKRTRIKNEKEYTIEYALPYNGYVLRQPPMKGEQRELEEKDPINWAAINGRIKRLAIDAKKPYLTTQSIYQSGMLYKILEIEEERGLLTKEDYINVVVAYGNDPSTYFSLKQLYITRFNPDTTDKIG